MKPEIFHIPAVPREHANVLGDAPRLTQSSYREAVRETMMGLQGRHGMTDQDMGDVIGVSAATVGNARNRKGDLTAVPMLAIGKEFGADALSTILRLINCKAVPADAVCLGNVSRIPINVAATLPLLIQLLSDDECCDNDVRVLQAAGAIDAIGQAADVLRARRDELRTRETI